MHEHIKQCDTMYNANSSEFNTFEQHPWHGVGQGAANATLGYIVLSDTLIDAYHTKVAPQMLTDPTHSDFRPKRYSQQ